MKIRSPTDLLAGLMFIVAGGGLAVLASAYRAGTAARMGPGFLPFWIGVLLVIVGLLVAASALALPGRRASSLDGVKSERLEHFDWRIAALILGSIVVFSLILRPLGLLVAMFVLVLMASAASREIGWKAAVLNALGLSGLCWLVFVKGLGLPLPVLPISLPWGS